MKATYIKLVGFRRMSLYGRKEFEVKLEEPVVLIEGINGSGKSSLMNQLSPLPSDRKDFFEGGYEEKHFTHNNDSYVLISDFTNKTPKYSFIYNGEDLNRAGIISAQKELVYKHFGITQTIHEIMTGAINFTDMSFATRKKVFSLPIKLNIDHVLRGYKELNDQLNLNKMMLKREQTQYKLEEDKLLSDDDYRLIRLEIKEKNEAIDELLKIRGELNRFINPESTLECYQDVSHSTKELNALIKENSFLLSINKKGTLVERETSLHEKVNRLSGIEHNLYEQIQQAYEVRKDFIDKTGEGEQTNIYDDITQLTAKLSELKQRSFIYIKDGLNYPSLDKLARQFYKIYDGASPILTDMEQNIDEETQEQKYGSALFSEANKQRDMAMGELHELKNLEHMIHENKNKIQNLEGKAECPSCHEIWPLKDIVITTEDARDMNYITKRRSDILKALKELTSYIDRSNTYFEQYSSLKKITTETIEDFPSFWEEIEKENLLFTYPQMILNKINILNVEFLTYQEYHTELKRLEQLQDKLKALESVQGISLESIDSNIRDLEYKVHGVREKISEYNNEVAIIEQVKAVYSKIDALTNSINLSIAKVKEHNLTDYASSIQNAIDDSIRDLRILNLENEKIVGEQESVVYTVRQLDANIKAIEENIKVLSLSLEELSPKTGIIAKTISSFLNLIIDEINKTIENVWVYKMVLKQIDLNNDVLNYRFKVEIEDRLPVQDIKDASSGQKEVINLAFRLVFYKILGFQNYPIYLDEIANRMDKYHTDNMGKLIHRFVTESQFSQYFIVSHKESMEFLREFQRVQV